MRAFFFLSLLLFLGGPLEGNADEKVKVALIQFESVTGDIQRNRDRLTTFVRKAAAEGAKIIVTPETAITGYAKEWYAPKFPITASEPKSPLGFADSVPGHLTQFFGELTKELDIYLVINFIEIAHFAVQPKYFNTSVLMDPNGKIVAHYRKLFPWSGYETSWASVGDRGVQVFDTKYGRVGLAICYDYRQIFPLYRNKDLWALLYSVAWVGDAPDHFFRRLPARMAIEKYFLLGANWANNNYDQTGYKSWGYSAVVGPGEVLAKASDEKEQIVYAEIPTKQ